MSCAMRAALPSRSTIGRFYGPLDAGLERSEVDPAALGEEGGQPPPRVHELALRSVELARLRAIARGCEVPQPGEQLVFAQPVALVERLRGGQELLPLEVPLGAPQDGREPRLGRRPLHHTCASTPCSGRGTAAGSSAST